VQDTESVTSLVLVPSGAHLVTCSRSLIMRIYSLPSGTLLHSVKPHETPVSALEVDSTSTLIATGGAEGFVKVWDVQGGYMTHFFKGHGGLVSALKFWGNAGESRWRLASGSEDCRIRIWDLVKKRFEL
jgi:U3 small nucleolar RNA-associated protein 13